MFSRRKICQDHCANSLLKNFSSLAWNLMFEVKRTESFSPAFDEFTLLISHPCFIGQGILTPVIRKECILLLVNRLINI